MSPLTTDEGNYAWWSHIQACPQCADYEFNDGLTGMLHPNRGQCEVGRKLTEQLLSIDEASP